MIKLIIFDLDGVLVDAKMIHFKALNRALEYFGQKYVISMEEHLSVFDGLSTDQKLEILFNMKALPKQSYFMVWSMKQNFTFDMIEEEIRPEEFLISVLKKLKEDGYILAVASNAIRKTVHKMLQAASIYEYFDYILSNGDVKNKKPHPEIYLDIMLQAGAAPIETLIVEDSLIGRVAANASGAHLLAVNHPKDISYDLIIEKIDKITREHKNTWDGENMNILIPMAGGGTRFVQAGYTFPKPLIDVHGKPMIQTVVENINIRGNYIFIVQKEHYEKYSLQHMLPLIVPNCKIIQVDGVTEGAACTTLLAKELINNDAPLLIANSDQLVDWDSSAFMYSMAGEHVDGGILTFYSTHPKWSYAKLGTNGLVSEVAEKKPISTLATVGIYYWKKGSDYVKYAEQMIAKDIRVNGEFYVCPVFNEAIQDGKRIKTHSAKRMHGLGTPEDLQEYLRTTYD